MLIISSIFGTIFTASTGWAAAIMRGAAIAILGFLVSWGGAFLVMMHKQWLMDKESLLDAEALGTHWNITS